MTSKANINPVLDFHSGFDNQDHEYSYWVNESNIEGDIPEGLSCTFFRNGPGKNQMAGKPYGHWFDGPGMVNALTIRDGKAHYKNRYVRTPKYLKERATGKISCRGFGTQVPGGITKNLLRQPTNPANTGIPFHGGKLMAQYEGGRPYEIDPATLETGNIVTYDGTLKGSNFFSAHGKIQGKTGDYINFGVSMNRMTMTGLKPNLDVFRISPRGKITGRCTIPLRQFPFLHDFAVTENHAVFFFSSVVIENIMGAALGTSTLAGNSRYRANMPVKILVVDLRNMKVVARSETDPHLIVHFCNAFEQGDEIICEYLRPDDADGFFALNDVFSMEELHGAPYHQVKVNVRTGKVSSQTIDDILPGEFPAWDPRTTGGYSRYSYVINTRDNGTPFFFNSISQWDRESGEVRVHDCGPNNYTSEALFIPRPGSKGENDGFLMSFVYNAESRKTEIPLVDARDMQQVANIKLDHHVPLGFHGFLTPEVFM